MTIKREESLKLALGMLLATIERLGSDPRDFVDYASGLISNAAKQLDGDELAVSAIAELHNAYADILRAKQGNES